MFSVIFDEEAEMDKMGDVTRGEGSSVHNLLLPYVFAAYGRNLVLGAKVSSIHAKPEELVCTSTLVWMVWSLFVRVQDMTL